MSWSDDKELLLGAYAQNNRGNVLKKLWGIETCYIKKKRCYVYNIFTTNYKWLVVICLNLKLTLRLLFYPNNN